MNKKVIMKRNRSPMPRDLRALSLEKEEGRLKNKIC